MKDYITIVLMGIVMILVLVAYVAFSVWLTKDETGCTAYPDRTGEYIESC